jgi:FKBP-type peptidyl-prolyl cis-trans isomerase (trigger factor)
LEDLLEEFRPAAEKRVKKSLILAELVKVEGIEVGDAEIEEEVGRMSRVYGREKEALKVALLGNEQIKEEIRNRLYGRKIASTLSGSSATDESQAGKVELARPDSPDPSPELDTEEDEE